MLWPGNRVRLPVGVELPEPRPEQDRAGQARKRALVVDDGRACEVLHSRARTASPPGSRSSGRRASRARTKTPPNDEVDPELRALGHRAPDDRERDAREHHLEQVAGGRRDRGEPAERRLADREQLVDRRRRSPSRRRSRCRRRRTPCRTRPGSRRCTRDRRRARSSRRCGRRSSSGRDPPRGRRSRPA